MQQPIVENGVVRQYIERVEMASDIPELKRIDSEVKGNFKVNKADTADIRRLIQERIEAMENKPKSIEKVDETALEIVVQKFSEIAVSQTLENATAIGKLVKEKMKHNHHYGRIPGAMKDSLWQPGADLILAGFKLHIEPVRIDRDEDSDGHFRYNVTVAVKPAGHPNVIVSTGDGAATTRETKYAYRWVPEYEIPKDIDKVTLKSKTTKNGVTFYRIPNPDIGDIENTLIKMARKRAKIAAVMELPGCSELFAE